MVRRLVPLALVVLVLLHQDFWWWSRPVVVFGFLPASLAYHAVYCIVAAALWWVAAVWAWPEDVETTADSAVAEEPPQ